MEADADGTLHLPLAWELRHGKIEVAAMRKAADGISSAVLRATPGMLQRHKEAFQSPRALGGLRDAIPDPVSWQRGLRQDRALPGEGLNELMDDNTAD